MTVTCGCERNAFGTIEKLCADHQHVEQRRCHGLIKRADELEAALKTVIGHWDEFGWECDFAEMIEIARRVVRK